MPGPGAVHEGFRIEEGVIGPQSVATERTPRMGCPDLLSRLIAKFTEQADQYRSADYNETQVRIDFINPMFKALGWDMDNIAGYAEPYRDVVHEDAIRIEGNTKAPDYSFRIGGVRKFFLE